MSSRIWQGSRTKGTIDCFIAKMKRQGLYICVYDSDLRRPYCGKEKKTLKHVKQKNNFYVIMFIVFELFGKMVNLENITITGMTIKYKIASEYV